MFVEGEFLRIAHAGREDFKVGSVRIATHDGARFGEREVRSLFARHIDRAIADREIEFAVRSEAQPVHVVPAERELDPKSTEQLFLHLRLTVVIGIAEVPEIRDAGPPHVPSAREDPRTGTVERIGEAVGEDRRFIRASAAGRVFHAADAILVGRKLFLKFRRIGVVMVHHGQPIGGRFRCDVLVLPLLVFAVVLDPALLPEGFRHIPPALLILGERYAVCDHGLRGPEFDLQSRIELKRFDRGFAFIRGGSDRRGRGSRAMTGGFRG